MKKISCTATLALMAVAATWCIVSALPTKITADDDDMDNTLYPIYEANPIKRNDHATERDVIKPPNLSGHSSGVENLQPTNQNKQPSSEDRDKLKSIAYNSREVRLVGPEKREVEMKDDLATKMVVALENLGKEAGGVWDQVNERLEKGWSELKTMVASKTKQVVPSQPLFSSGKASSLVVEVGEGDGYLLADDDSTSVKQAAESSGNKIKGFLTNIGLTEENQKKAGESLSKAGASVSEVVTKDLPEAMKKAGSAISETFTNDIPNAFKNIFG